MKNIKGLSDKLNEEGVIMASGADVAELLQDELTALMDDINEYKDKRTPWEVEADDESIKDLKEDIEMARSNQSVMYEVQLCEMSPSGLLVKKVEDA